MIGSFLLNPMKKMEFLILNTQVKLITHGWLLLLKGGDLLLCSAKASAPAIKRRGVNLRDYYVLVSK